MGWRKFTGREIVTEGQELLLSMGSRLKGDFFQARVIVLEVHKDWCTVTVEEILRKYAGVSVWKGESKRVFWKDLKYKA